MKKFLLAVCMMALSVGVCSCSKDHDEGNNCAKMESHLCGVEWKEYGTQRMVRMYRNHLVETWVKEKPVVGQLTDNGSFYGTWMLVCDKLNTTFNAGVNYGFNQNMLMYGTMTVGTDEWNEWHGKDTQGKEHEYYYEKQFTDYTDDTAHDKALHGTWTTTVKVSSEGNIRECTLTIMVSRDGSVRYVLPELDNTDRTSTYTTKNGHVSLTDFVQDGRNVSYIYVRYDDRIEFYDEEKGITAMRLYVKK